MMAEQSFDLKLQDGREVTWSGSDELDAAHRYVDAHRDAVVVATRPHIDRVGVFVWGGQRILEPGDQGW